MTNFQIKMPDEQARKLNELLESVMSTLGEGATKAAAMEALYPSMVASAETAVRPDTAPYVSAIAEACSSIIAHADALAKAYANHENAAEAKAKESLGSLQRALEEAQAQRDEALARAEKAETSNAERFNGLIETVKKLKGENEGLSARVKELEAKEKSFEDLRALIEGMRSADKMQ